MPCVQQWHGWLSARWIFHYIKCLKERGGVKCEAGKQGQPLNVHVLSMFALSYSLDPLRLPSWTVLQVVLNQHKSTPCCQAHFTLACYDAFELLLLKLLFFFLHYHDSLSAFQWLILWMPIPPFVWSILTLPLSFQGMIYLAVMQGTGNANTLTGKAVAALSALSLCLFSGEREKEKERGRPVFRTLNTRNVAPA